MSDEQAPILLGPIVIPVCYDAVFGPDLSDVATHGGIPIEEVIRLHSAAIYTVYFLGFSPGFGYLGGLPKPLHMPRLATPRVRVAAGSVGIAGEQSAVYPGETAGGWRIIGRTPLKMFNATSDQPSRLQPGDRVRFAPVSGNRRRSGRRRSGWPWSSGWETARYGSGRRSRRPRP